MSADKRDATLAAARQSQEALSALRDELQAKAESMQSEYICPTLPGDGRGEVSDALLATLAVSPLATPRSRCDCQSASCLIRARTAMISAIKRTCPITHLSLQESLAKVANAVHTTASQVSELVASQAYSVESATQDTKAAAMVRCMPKCRLFLRPTILCAQFDRATAESFGRDSLWQLHPVPFPVHAKHYQRLAPGDIPPLARPPASSEGAPALSARVASLKTAGDAATPRGAPPSSSFASPGAGGGGSISRRASAVERPNTIRHVSSAQHPPGSDAQGGYSANGGYDVPATFRITEGRPLPSQDA